MRSNPNIEVHVSHRAPKVTPSSGHIYVDKLKRAAYLRAMTQVTRIDAKGLLCPLPVLKLAKVIKRAASGDVLELCADDPAAVIDVPHFCTESGHTFLGKTDEGAHTVYRVQKG